MPTNTTYEEACFITNMKRAWYFIFDNIEHPNNLSFLREVNKICMAGLSYDAGNIRNIPVSIGGTSWRVDLPQEGVLIEEIARVDNIADKLECALEMFCFIARSQMFLDGNKRVAQLLCNKIMMENDLGIFSIPYDRIDAFSYKLIDFYETGESGEIKHFFKNECLLLNYNNPAVNLL